MATTTVNNDSLIYDQINSANNRGTTTKAEDQQTKFLTLLTTQLKNQDPLNPMDNAQMTSQLAQISTVDGIERLNTTLASMMSSTSETQALQMAALVGHGALVDGNNLPLTEMRVPLAALIWPVHPIASRSRSRMGTAMSCAPSTWKIRRPACRTSSGMARTMRRGC